MGLPTVAEAFIDRLKAQSGVSSDDALSEKIGVGKSTIASWRRRGLIPARARDELSEKLSVVYSEVVDDVFATWLDESRAGDTVLLILAMRLALKTPETKLVDWSRWLSVWRKEVLVEISQRSGGWDPSKESLADRLSSIVLTVTEGDRFGADFLLQLRPKLEEGLNSARKFKCHRT